MVLVLAQDTVPWYPEGRREPDARMEDSPVRRIAKAIVGFVLILVGLVLAIPGVPGPGLAIVVLGLVVLSEQFHWARRIVEWGKQEWRRLRARFGRSPQPGPPPERQ